MSEINICPVCMKQIPLKALECCFYCGFDLKKQNNQQLIEKAKQRFPCVKNGGEENTEWFAQEGYGMSSIRNYYISGLIGSSLPALVILVLVFWSLGILLWAFALPVWLVSGFSAGLVGCKFASNQSDFKNFIATTLLGFLIASLMSLLVMFNLL